MSVAISTQSIPGDFYSKIEAIANSGFSALDLGNFDLVCCDSTPEVMGERVKSLGLEVNAFLCQDSLEGHTGNKRSIAFDRLKWNLEKTTKLGGKVVVMPANTDVFSDSAIDSLAADLREAGEIAEGFDLRLAYMALPWARSIQDCFAAENIIKKVDHPSVGLGLSSFYTLPVVSKPAALGSVYEGKIFYIALADVALSNLEFGHFFQQVRLLPGLGDLNLTDFVRLLAKGGYDGCWSLDGINELNIHGDISRAVLDGYRSIVTLLNRVAKRELDVDFDIPVLPPRVYPFGVEFIEFAAGGDDYEVLKTLLQSMRFRLERKHKTKDVELWRQGAVNILINREKSGHAREIYNKQGVAICDIGLQVENAQATVQRAKLLKIDIAHHPLGSGTLEIPAIYGAGRSLIHFIDDESRMFRVWDIEFTPASTNSQLQPAGLRRIDHIAQTMKYHEMQSRALFYLSNFKMDKAPVVGLSDPLGKIFSQSLHSPEGELRLNLNSSPVEETFAGKFLGSSKEARVQHVAFLTNNIFESSKMLIESNFPFLSIPANYYQYLQYRYNLTDDFVARLKTGHILYDRVADTEFFQIFSIPVFSGFFFEVVERKNGYSGYGAANAAIRIAAQTQFINAQKT